MKGFQPTSNSSSGSLSPDSNNSPSEIKSLLPQRSITSLTSLLNKRNSNDNGNDFIFHHALEKKVKTIKDDLQHADMSFSSLKAPSETAVSTYTSYATTGLEGHDQVLKALILQQAQQFQQFKLGLYLQSMSNVKNPFEMLQNQIYQQKNQIANLMANSLMLNQNQVEIAQPEPLKVKDCNTEPVKPEPKVEEDVVSEKISYTPAKKIQIKVKPQVQPRRKPIEKTNENEPVLAELTREYPDWDLSKIFEFMKSGQSRESFENGKKDRVIKKPKMAVPKQRAMVKKPGKAQKHMIFGGISGEIQV